MLEKVRIDKFLWAVRLFKKRSDAAAACGKGNILVDGMPAKASKKIMVGSEIAVKNFVIHRIYKVKDLLEKRVGAKFVENYIEEITTEEELFKLKVYYESRKIHVNRDKPGRPTKKDRRDLDKFFGNE